MLIRRGNKDDDSALLALWERAVRATHHFLCEDDIIAYRSFVLHDGLPNVEIWIAEGDAGDLSGFVGVCGDKIEMLFVDPGRHRQGIARRLLEHVEGERTLRHVDVNEQNEEAHAFYRQQGFVAVGRSDRDGTGRQYPLIHMEKAVSM